MTPPAAGALLRGVDRAAFVTAFGRRLRGAGVDVGLTSLRDFADALAVLPPGSRSGLYWTARVTLVRRPADLPVFDRVFAAVFDDAVLAVDPNARRRPRPTSAPDTRNLPLAEGGGPEEAGEGLPWVTLPKATGVSADDASDLLLPERLPSRLVGLADTPFDDLDPADLALLGRWLDEAMRDWPRRRTRRQAVRPGGARVALRPTVARARRTAWEPITLVRTRGIDKPRRLVMLCDVSQSMQVFTTAYLHLMRAAALTGGSEAFAFSTSLTRLTAVLRHKSAEVAIAEASDRVGDRFGGTRIATNIRALLGSHRGNAVRGAVVVIASDGWDSDPPEALAAAMARLHRRAHRVIWLNPRAAAPGYAPLVGGMAAALPFCDELLPADCLSALADVVRAITRAS